MAKIPLCCRNGHIPLSRRPPCLGASCSSGSISASQVGHRSLHRSVPFLPPIRTAWTRSSWPLSSLLQHLRVTSWRVSGVFIGRQDGCIELFSRKGSHRRRHAGANCRLAVPRFAPDFRLRMRRLRGLAACHRGRPEPSYWRDQRRRESLQSLLLRAGGWRCLTAVGAPCRDPD